MSTWTRVFFRESDKEFDGRHEYSEKPVWIFVQSESEAGVRQGQMCEYADESLEPREFFFDGRGRPVTPSHWQERNDERDPPEAPGASFFLCEDGEPHDWVARPVLNEEGLETGGEVTVCAKCHAVGDSS